jgi:hypothetical protein
MDPIYGISYYLEFKRQLSSRKAAPPEPFADASDERSFDQLDPLPIKKMRARLVEIALAFILFAALMTFGLACFLSLT